ncbi:putative cytochrome c-type biogenesis protein [Erwinia amylovora MR1]|nr:putative cytochrome c-type biogenesis protein [Erwinia amylovora MR1]
MSGFWLIIALLLVASCMLVVLAGSRCNSASANDRDTLNQRFYHQRLRELEDDEAQGVVDDRPEMVRELQLALLMDIPERSPVIQRQVSRRVLLPGVWSCC